MYSKRRLVKGVYAKFSCTKAERVYVAACAKKSGMTLSTYLRKGALQGFTSKDKSLPSEVLAFQGVLAQICGHLDIISRKRLDGDDLNALERAQIRELVRSLQELDKQLKNPLL